MKTGDRAQRMGVGLEKRDRIVRCLFSAVCFLIPVIWLLSFNAHAVVTDKKPALQFGRNQAIQQVKPKKPVKIKLHRTAKGEYQWDITGDNPDEIARADKRLRKLLEVE